MDMGRGGGGGCDGGGGRDGGGGSGARSAHARRSGAWAAGGPEEGEGSEEAEEAGEAELEGTTGDGELGVARLEPWEEARPVVAEWLDSMLDSPPEAADDSPLLRYAAALVSSLRLDELGLLARYLERRVGGRAAWRPALQHFADAVDGMLEAEYGGTFEPLRGIRKQLAEGRRGESASDPWVVA